MVILLPTGAAIGTDSEKSGGAAFDADVIVTGEIASFLTPHSLSDLLIKKGHYEIRRSSPECALPLFDQEDNGVTCLLYLWLRATQRISPFIPAPARHPLPSPRTVPAG